MKNAKGLSRRDVRLDLPLKAVDDETVKGVLRSIRNIRDRPNAVPSPSTSGPEGSHLDPLELSRNSSRVSVMFGFGRKRSNQGESPGEAAQLEVARTTSRLSVDDGVGRESSSVCIDQAEAAHLEVAKTSSRLSVNPGVGRQTSSVSVNQADELSSKRGVDVELSIMRIPSSRSENFGSYPVEFQSDAVVTTTPSNNGVVESLEGTFSRVCHDATSSSNPRNQSNQVENIGGGVLRELINTVEEQAGGAMNVVFQDSKDVLEGRDDDVASHIDETHVTNEARTSRKDIGPEEVDDPALPHSDEESRLPSESPDGGLNQVYQSEFRFLHLDRNGSLKYKAYPIEIESDVISPNGAMAMSGFLGVKDGRDDFTCGTNGTFLTIVPDHLKNIITSRALQRIKNNHLYPWKRQPLRLKEKAMEELLEIVRCEGDLGDSMCNLRNDTQRNLDEMERQHTTNVRKYLTSRIDFARRIKHKKKPFSQVEFDEIIGRGYDPFRFNGTNLLRSKPLALSPVDELIHGLRDDFVELEGFVRENANLQNCSPDNGVISRVRSDHEEPGGLGPEGIIIKFDRNFMCNDDTSDALNCDGQEFDHVNHRSSNKRAFTSRRDKSAVVTLAKTIVENAHPIDLPPMKTSTPRPRVLDASDDIFPALSHDSMSVLQNASVAGWTGERPAKSSLEKSRNVRHHLASKEQNVTAVTSTRYDSERVKDPNIAFGRGIFNKKHADAAHETFNATDESSMMEEEVINVSKSKCKHSVNKRQLLTTSMSTPDLVSGPKDSPQINRKATKLPSEWHGPTRNTGETNARHRMPDDLHNNQSSHNKTKCKRSGIERHEALDEADRKVRSHSKTKSKPAALERHELLHEPDHKERGESKKHSAIESHDPLDEADHKVRSQSKTKTKHSALERHEPLDEAGDKAHSQSKPKAKHSAFERREPLDEVGHKVRSHSKTKSKHSAIERQGPLDEPAHKVLECKRNAKHPAGERVGPPDEVNQNVRSHSKSRPTQVTELQRSPDEKVFRQHKSKAKHALPERHGSPEDVDHKAVSPCKRRPKHSPGERHASPEVVDRNIPSQGLGKSNHLGIERYGFNDEVEPDELSQQETASLNSRDETSSIESAYNRRSRRNAGDRSRSTRFTGSNTSGYDSHDESTDYNRRSRSRNRRGRGHLSSAARVSKRDTNMFGYSARDILTTDIEDVWLAKGILQGVAFSQNKSVEQVVEDICDHLDDLEHNFWRPTRKNTKRRMRADSETWRTGIETE